MVEVLVALSIFTIVMTISVGSLLVLLDANNKAQSMQIVISNLSFAVDSMTREIRTGTHYYCANSSSVNSSALLGVNNHNNCAGGDGALAFTEGGTSLTAGTGSRRITYRLNGNTLERRLGNSTSASAWQALTAPSVIIEELRFFVTGATDGDGFAPTATIFIRGRVEGLEVQTSSEFALHTTVAQQLLDI